MKGLGFRGSWVYGFMGVYIGPLWGLRMGLRFGVPGLRSCFNRFRVFGVSGSLV